MGLDAESYLRDLSEQWRGAHSGDRPLSASPLAAAAAALVAVGAVSAGRAERLLDACDLSWDFQFSHSRPGSVSPSHKVGYISPDRIGRSRVVAIDTELILPAGTLRLRYAVLEPDHTAIFADFEVRGTTTGLHDWIRVPAGMPSGLARPDVAEQSGSTRTMEFNGHGNDDRWSGQFSTRTAVAVDAPWIELFEARVGLTGSPAPTRVTIEPVHSADPAQLHLLRALATADASSDQNPRAAAGALVRAGAIGPEDPVMVQINAGETDELLRRRGPDHLSRSAGLPAPWPAPRSDARAGPTGMIVVGLATEEFHGHRVAVLVLRSRPDGFVVEAEVTSIATNRSILEDDHLVWWARDDRGQDYLGTWDSWSRHSASGVLRFFPPLDPEARRLDLMPSTPTTRAVIAIGLVWEPAGV